MGASVQGGEGRPGGVKGRGGAGGGTTVAAAQSQASLSALNRQGWVLVPPSHRRPDKLLLSEGQPSAPGSHYFWSLVSLSPL